MDSNSRRQEKEIAKYLGGKVTPNSGGTRSSGGDVHTNAFLIEAKTRDKLSKTFTISREWLAKAHEQSIGQNKPHWALAFRYSPEGEDYFIINKHLMILLNNYLGVE